MTYTKREGKFQLGRTPGRSLPEDALRLSDYLVDPLPVFTGSDDFTSGIKNWGMAGNDTYGDCGVAGDYHLNMANAATAKETRLAVPNDGTTVSNEVVAEYLAYDNGQDNGVDLASWLKYRLTHRLAGLPKIGGFAQVSVEGQEFASALHVFGGLYTGVLISQEAMDEAESDPPQPWTSTATDFIGGHCVPVLFRNPTEGKVVTWGFVQAFSWAWWKVAAEEAFVVFTPEQVAAPGGVFHGVKVAQLKADIQKLHGTL